MRQSVDKHSPSLPGSLGGVPEHFNQKVETARRDNRIILARAREWVKEHFEQAVIDQYRGVLDGAILSRCKRMWTNYSNDALWVEVGKKIKVVDTTWGRWIHEDPKQRTSPSWEHICLALAAYDVALGDSLPRGRDTVVNALSVVVPDFRVRFLGGQREELPDWRIGCLHFITQSVTWTRAVSEPSAENRRRAVEVLVAKMERVYKQKSMERVEELRLFDDLARWAEGWTVAWCVFHWVMSYEYDWNYADDGRSTVYV